MVSLPRWKQVLCSFAGVLFLVGIGMKSVLFFRDGLLGPHSGSPARLLDPPPGVKWPGPGPGVTDVPGDEPSPGAETAPRSGVKKSSGSGNATLPSPAVPGSPAQSPQQQRRALEVASGTIANPRSVGQGAPAPAEPGFDQDLIEEWSPAFLKGGLGFFVAFILGFALQAFARLFAIFLGLFFLAVLGLSSMGWITIEWQVAQEQFLAFPSVLAQQFTGFESFLQGALPSIGMAGLGLFAGLRKK